MSNAAARDGEIARCEFWDLDFTLASMTEAAVEEKTIVRRYAPSVSPG